MFSCPYWSFNLHFRYIIPIYILIFVITTCVNVYAVSDAEIEMLIGSMSVEEKVGQLLMYGIGGREVGPIPKGHITKRFVGGIILYGRNIQTPQQVATLTTELQQLAQETPNGIPLFISIDQEGGIVNRMNKGATVLPGNLALGATRSITLAEKAGEITAIELATVGVNLNFAPVLDVNTNPLNPVIGVRAYGESPQLVSQLGTAYIRGLQKNGVLATAKHFPGHGDTHVDSHKKLPIVTHDLKRVNSVELVPFRAAIEADVAAIMSAHILYPSLDTQYPATLSYKILTTILRRQLGYDGLIITDDLEMQAIDDKYDTGDAAVMAIQAGADIVIVAWTLKKQQRVYNALRQAVKTRKITETRLNESVRRILKKKSACGAFEKPYVQIENPNAINSPLAKIGSAKHRDVAQTIATRAITLVKNTPGTLPLKSEPQEPVLLISPSREFSNTFLKAHTDISNITPVLIPLQINQKLLLPQILLSKPSLIVAGIVNAQQANLVHQISEKTDVPIIVISLRTPYLLGKCPDVACSVAAYDDNHYSVLAAVEVLLGKRAAVGKLPVTIP